MNYKIPFNKPYLTGKEVFYIHQAVLSGKISGDGIFTKKCHDYFENNYGFKKCLLTTSCTDALEMAAILLDIREGDEIIMPSYTFVSTANAFVLRGAKIVFVDSSKENPNMDVNQLCQLITPKTKAIVIVHYGGVACDMDEVMSIAQKHNLFVIEDAAQAIESYYKNKRLGSIGHLAAFSFHETKNVISGEGGMLVINDEKFINRAEIIREKGTNRSAFFRGETDKYSWVDIGSSFLPSDIIAAFLFAQLENLENIQNKRKKIWNKYYNGLKSLEINAKLKLPKLPNYASNNAHLFYVICNNITERQNLIEELKNHSILATFHYVSLHNSSFHQSNQINQNNKKLINCEMYSDCLLRLPLYYELDEEEQNSVIDIIKKFYNS